MNYIWTSTNFCKSSGKTWKLCEKRRKMRKRMNLKGVIHMFCFLDTIMWATKELSHKLDSNVQNFPFLNCEKTAERNLTKSITASPSKELSSTDCCKNKSICKFYLRTGLKRTCFSKKIKKTLVFSLISRRRTIFQGQKFGI